MKVVKSMMLNNNIVIYTFLIPSSEYNFFNNSGCISIAWAVMALII